jgi:hypothetical protein
VRKNGDVQCRALGVDGVDCSHFCMTHVSAMRALRTFFGVLPLVAIGRQFAIHLSLGFNALNFLSYFTNLGNLFAACVLLVAANFVNGYGVVLARATAVIAMTIVGVVFSVLLRDADLGALEPWVNFIVHYLMPCVIVLDWLLWPPRIALGAPDLALCLLFPLLYVCYTLLRGSLSGWYPYGFLNPASVGGFGVAIYVAGITALFLVVGRLLLAVANWRLAPPR